MKRLYRIACLTSLLAASLALSGCADALGSVTSLTAVKTDPSMPTIKGIKTIVDRTSVGFEWQPVTDKRAEGIDVYRALATGGAQERYTKIATIPNRYATHFVDTSIRPSTTYNYTFKTYGVLFGSAPGQIVRVKTAPPMPPVNLVKAYQPDPGVVKLLWTPHRDPRIVDYLIERRLDGGPWKYLDTVKGRLSPEYIDMSPAKGHRYGYRVIARSADKILSVPSRSLDLTIH
jgi:fibronectin type 3 domain-containing protein